MGPSPTDTVEAWQSLSRVRTALEVLEVGHRAVFVLFELQGEPCDEIAAGLGIPVGTVYSRLHKARKQFTEAYAKLTGKSVSELMMGTAGQRGRA
jgi:RNA polymerase sigma-70 factor (ECF subfamily)